MILAELTHKLNNLSKNLKIYFEKKKQSYIRTKLKTVKLKNLYFMHDLFQFIVKYHLP